MRGNKRGLMAWRAAHVRAPIISRIAAPDLATLMRRDNRRLFVALKVSPQNDGDETAGSRRGSGIFVNEARFMKRGSLAGNSIMSSAIPRGILPFASEIR